MNLLDLFPFKFVLNGFFANMRVIAMLPHQNLRGRVLKDVHVLDRREGFDGGFQFLVPFDFWVENDFRVGHAPFDNVFDFVKRRERVLQRRDIGAGAACGGFDGRLPRMLLLAHCVADSTDMAVSHGLRMVGRPRAMAQTHTAISVLLLEFGQHRLDES